MLVYLDKYYYIYLDKYYYIYLNLCLINHPWLILNQLEFSPLSQFPLRLIVYKIDIVIKMHCEIIFCNVLEFFILMTFNDFLDNYYSHPQQAELVILLDKIDIYSDIESTLNDFYMAVASRNKNEIISQFVLSTREFLTKTFSGIKCKRKLYFLFDGFICDFKVELPLRHLIAFLTLFHYLHEAGTIKVVGNRGLFVYLRQHLQSPLTEKYPKRDFRKLRHEAAQKDCKTNATMRFLKPLLDKYHIGR